MKRFLIIFLYLCCMTGMYAQDCTPTRDVQETDSGIVVTYWFHGGIQQDDPLHPGAKFWKIPGFALNSRVGEPAFPSRWDTFVIPKDVTPFVEVTDSVYSEIPFVMAPAYPFLSMSDTIGYTLERVPNVTPFFGHLPCHIVLQGNVRKYKSQDLLNVGIAPVQYDYVNEKVRAYSMIRYYIRYENPNIVRCENKSVNPQLKDVFLANVALNYNSQSSRTKNFTPIDTSSVTQENKTYLILTTPTFHTACQEFASWKRQKGYNVCVYEMQYTAAGPTYRSEKMLEAMQQVKESWGNLCYVLLVGNYSTMPGHSCHYEFGKDPYGQLQICSYDFPSDYYYECLGDTTNAPLVRVGRIPVDTNVQAKAVFDKIIAYEQDPTNDDNFYNTAVNCAVFDSGYPMFNREASRAIYSSENIISYLENSIVDTKDVKRIYLNVFNNSQDPWAYSNFWSPGNNLPSYLLDPYVWNGNYQNITDSINAGTFLFSYIGHGSKTGWENIEKDSQIVTLYSESYADSLHNHQLFPVILSMSCHTGAYHHSTNCPAEFFLSKPNVGAVAVVAPSSSTYYGFTEYLAEGIINAMWPNPGINDIHPVDSAFYELGDLMAVSRDWLGYMSWYNDTTHQLSDSVLHDESSLYHYQRDIFHLFGDPSMQIYTSKPNHFTNATLRREGNTFYVNTNEPDTYVAFYDPDSEESVLYRGSSIQHSFDIENVNNMYITIYKHNFVPSVLKYSNAIAIQNVTISDQRAFISEQISVGSNVTNEILLGNAIIASGAKIAFEGGNVILHPGTYIERGAQVTINQGYVKFY